MFKHTHDCPAHPRRAADIALTAVIGLPIWWVGWKFLDAAYAMLG